MSYTALFETNIGNGKKNRGVKQTGEKSWTITAIGKVTADFHTVRLITDTVEPNKTTMVVKYLAKNTGNTSGDVHVAIGKLKADGSVMYEGSKRVKVSPDVCVSLNATIYDDMVAVGDPHSGDCGSIAEAGIRVYISVGTHYIGVRTWGEDEKKPSYPKPTAAMIPAPLAAPAPEKWCTPAVGPIPEICLEPLQWAAVAGAGIASVVLTYAGVRAVRGKSIV